MIRAAKQKFGLEQFHMPHFSGICAHVPPDDARLSAPFVDTVSLSPESKHGIIGASVVS